MILVQNYLLIGFKRITHNSVNTLFINITNILPSIWSGARLHISKLRILTLSALMWTLFLPFIWKMSRPFVLSWRCGSQSCAAFQVWMPHCFIGDRCALLSIQGSALQKTVSQMVIHYHSRSISGITLTTEILYSCTSFEPILSSIINLQEDCDFVICGFLWQ